MSGLTPLSPFASVPYRDSVAPVRGVARVDLRLDGPAGERPRAKARSPEAEARARHSAASAAAGFAAHVLFEAGAAGQDPSSTERAARAYARAPMIPATRLRLVA
jgi:hypothetical protein